MQTDHPEQVVLARHLFDEAEVLLQRQDQFSAFRALLFLDLAVETALNAALLDAHPEELAKLKEKNPALMTLYRAAAGVVPDLAQHAPKINRLHKLRNGAQHDGNAPTTATVNRFVPAVRAVLTVLYRECYRKEFARVTLWSTIDHPEIPAFVEALHAIRATDALHALAGMVLLHEFAARILGSRHTAIHDPAVTGTPYLVADEAIRTIPTKHFGQRRDDLSLSMIALFDDLGRTVTKLLQQEHREINNLTATMIAVGLGLSVVDARKFQYWSMRLPVIPLVTPFPSGASFVLFGHPNEAGQPELPADLWDFFEGYVFRFLQRIQASDADTIGAIPTSELQAFLDVGVRFGIRPNIVRSFED